MVNRLADYVSRTRRSPEPPFPVHADEGAAHACGVCAVEHPPNDPACRCPNCICEECWPNECPCVGAGEKARKDHDRGLFTGPLSRLGRWPLPAGSA